MSKRFMCLVCLTFIITAANVSAAPQKRYSIKSGIVEYSVSGMQEGVTTLYFDEFGQKEARYTNSTSKFMGFSQSTQDVNFIDGDFAYHYDPKTNSATKMNYKEFAADLAKARGKKSIEDFGEEMMKEMGGTKTGSKKILGYKCDVWEIPNFMTTACVYKNSIPLEMSSTFANFNVTQVATKFQENAKIPKDKIELPQNASIKDMGKLSDHMSPEQAAQVQAMDSEEIKGLGDVMKMFGDMQKQGAVNQQEGISERELELKAKELEIKRMELELQQKQLELQASSLEQAQQPSKGTLEQVDGAVDTTNKLKNSIGGLKSLFGR